MPPAKRTPAMESEPASPTAKAVKMQNVSKSLKQSCPELRCRLANEKRPQDHTSSTAKLLGALLVFYTVNAHGPNSKMGPFKSSTAGTFWWEVYGGVIWVSTNCWHWEGSRENPKFWLTKLLFRSLLSLRCTWIGSTSPSTSQWALQKGIESFMCCTNFQCSLHLSYSPHRPRH